MCVSGAAVWEFPEISIASTTQQREPNAKTKGSEFHTIEQTKFIGSNHPCRGGLIEIYLHSDFFYHERIIPVPRYRSHIEPCQVLSTK